MEVHESMVQKVERLAKAPKSLRKMLISEQSTEEAKICAAIEIQRIARGYIVRSLGLELFVAWRENLVPKINDIDSTPRSARSYKSTKRNVSRRSARQADTPPMIPQAPNSKKKQQKLTVTPIQAAIKIQRFWRRHIDMQVYKYYRDLINFKVQGDPSVMLKCVNPKEASLLDAASGTHIKFRLAGERFPPNIYYKIYTHRPIQDLCANAPRDYTKSGKKKDMRGRHNKNYITADKENYETWYQRIENNGWRLVSDRLMPHMLSDPITWSTHNKKITFPHSKLLRREDVERARKKKKIDWMKKMYQQGMLHAKTTDPETKALVEGATSGMLTTIQLEGESAVAEWEVDELIDWTTNLNYEDYMSSWKQLGTSSLSEAPVDQRLYLSLDPDDDFGINIESTQPGQSPKLAEAAQPTSSSITQSKTVLTTTVTE